MKRLNKIISSVVLVCFIWNTAVQDYAFGLATMPGSTQPDTREAMFAAGQKELATHEYGPGSGISDKLDKYSPGQFIGDVPAVNWLEFVPTSNEDGIPDGWEKNPILQKTNLVKAFEYFRDHEADLDETRLEIVEGDFKLEKGNSGEIPICRIEQDARTLRYRLVIHKDFVRMWADIKKNDVQFKYRFPDGTVRTVSLAWAIFYRIAKHEMSDIVSRDGKGQFTPKSHGHMEYILPHPGWFGTSEVHDEESDERAANEIRGKYAIVNDGLWMWFLGSYCFGPATQYSDVMFKDRALWFLGLYEGPKAEEWNRWAVEHELPYEFPNLRDAAARAEALSIARAVNKRFYTNYNRYEASASPESETRMARDLTERTPRILKVLPATGISTSSNKAFLQKLNAYIDNKKAMDVLLANPDNWKDKAQDILDLKNKVSFALEELWMESEVVALSTEERAGAVVVKSIKDGDLLCNHRTKEVFRFSEAERGRVMTQAQEIVILQPLSLTVGERKTRDELVTKLRSNDRDIKGRMVAIKALKSMVESGILPKPFEVGDVFQHCHSTYSHSPGNTPSYIAWRGYVLGLMVTGIVDHDTVGGFKEFRQAAGILGLRNPTSGYEQRVMPKGTPFETMTTNSPGNKGETYVAFHGIARDKHEMQEKKVVPAKVKRFTKIASLINEIAGLGLDYKRHIKPLTEAGNPTEKHVAEAIAQLIYEKFKDDIGRGEWSGVVGCANRIIAECCKRAGETRDLTIVKQSDVDKTKDLTKFTFLIRDRVVTVAKQIPGYAPTEDEVIRDSEVYEDAHRHNELVYYCYLGDLKKCEAENRTILTRAEKDKFLEEKGRGGIKDATIQRWLDKEDASMLHLWFSYQRDMGVDGIAFMPNRNRPQEVEDVIKIAEEVGFKHIANGMDVNTPDMPFTYFDYSNRQAFVEESLFIVEHERKMRQTAAALNHSICNALVSLAVENQNELNNMFRGFTFVEYDKKHKVYWFGHRLGSKSNFLDIFNMLVRLTAREKGYDAVGAQDEKDTLNKIVTRAGLAASATYLNLESVKKSLGLQAEHVDVETGTVYIMTEHKGTELGSRMIRHARFERGLHLALTRSSGHDMAAYKLWRLGSPLQWLINSSLRVGGKEYVLSSSKSGMMCTYNEFAQMAHNTANEYYPIEARDVSEGMDFAYSVNAVISSLAVDRDVEGRIMDGMAKAMDDGLAGQPSSLKMIPAYVGAATGEEEGDYFAIDVGGTNLRVLGVRLEKGKKPSLIGNTEKAAIPSSITKGGTAEELFGFIVSTIKEYARKNGIDPKSGMKFGITWSFPVEQTGVASGIHKEWTKGWDVSGVVGQDPVALLHAALAREGLQSVRIMAMCNDTVGTLMFGDIGVILGTGTNAAFPIAVKDIGKFNGKTDLDVMAINSEWGNFDGVPTKAWDDLLDRISNNPGKQKLEKMISGMYLGEVARHIINMLISDGKLFNGRQYPVFENKPVESGKDGFTPELMSNIRKVDPATDPDLIGAETILAGIGVTETTPSDRRIVRDICNAVSLRAAKVSASVLAAMIKKSGVLERKDICRVAIDGSVFKHDYRFKEMMELALVEIFGADVAARIELVLAEDGSGVGAAIIAAVADRSEKTAASRSGTATVPNPHDEMTGEGDTSKNALRRDLGLDREAPARTPALSTEMVQTHDWTVREIATANWVNEADAVREIVSYLITEGGSRELAVIVDELMVNSDEKLNKVFDLLLKRLDSRGAKPKDPKLNKELVISMIERVRAYSASGLTIKDIETKFSRPEFIPAKANLTKIYGEAGDYVVCRYDMPGREKAHFIVVYDKTNGQAPEWFAKGRDYPLEYKGSTVVRLHKAQHLIAVYNTERTSWDDNAGLSEHYLLLDTKAGRVVVDSGAARSYNGPESYKTVVGRDYCVLLERGVNYNTHYVDKKQQAHEAYVELNIHSLTGRRAIHSLNSYWFSREHLSNLQDIKIIGGHYLLMEYLPSAESCYIELYDIRELLKTDSLPRPFYASSCAGYVYEPQTNKFSVDGQTIDLTAPDSRDEMTGEGDTSKNALRRDLGLNGEAPVAQAVSITPAYALPKQKSSLGMADDSWTIEQIQRSRSFEAVKRDGHVPLRKGYHILTDAFRRGQHYYNRYEITQTSKGGYIGLEPVSRDGSRRIGSEFFTSRGTLDAAITFVKRTRSVAPQQNNTVGRPREAGKSPLDLLTLIRRNIKPGDVISAPILYDFYLAQYKKLRFEAPAKRDSALRTIERDLFGAINSLLAMRFIRELPGKGPNGERQFVEVTYDTRAARTNVAQVGTPVKSILEVIDEYGAPISRENGPGVLMPSPTEIASFYPAISMLESERVEVYLPKNISDSLTRSVTEEIRRINIVIRERIREHTARTDNIDDPIKVVPYNSSNLESCLGRKGDGVRRIFVNDISMTADFRRLTDSEGGLDLLRGARIFTAAVPAGRGETEKTVNQAWLIKVAILVSLLDESNIVTIGATLRAELEGRGIDDPVKFVLNLSKVEDSSISRERVRDRINYFLGNIVVLSTFIGEQLRILKAFWIAA